nr:hypothetical protein [Tanacetum cinerariifolium]
MATITEIFEKVRSFPEQSELIRDHSTRAQKIWLTIRRYRLVGKRAHLPTKKKQKETILLNHHVNGNHHGDFRESKKLSGAVG